VLASGITLIHDGQLFYRGHDAVALARHATLEQAATLLWDADEQDAQRLFSQRGPLSAAQLSSITRLASDRLSLMQAALPVAGSQDVASYDLTPLAVRMTGARIIRLLTSVVAGRDSDRPIHQALQTKWKPGKPAVADVIRTALVLCADHELNVSAFAARCAASAGASPYHVVAAALATFRGFKHGAAAERVIALLAEIRTARDPRAVIAGRLRRGERLPGFGHRLYPNGDPRATELLRLAEAGGNDGEWRRVRGLVKAGAQLLEDGPNLDLGLAAVTRVYGLPDEAPAIIFALGRTAGWIAHAIEEYASGELIRPRARYVGRMPS
jgi:citrate synthase